MKPQGEKRTTLKSVLTPEEYEDHRRVSLGFILDAYHPNNSYCNILWLQVQKVTLERGRRARISEKFTTLQNLANSITGNDVRLIR